MQTVNDGAVAAVDDEPNGWQPAKPLSPKTRSPRVEKEAQEVLAELAKTSRVIEQEFRECPIPRTAKLLDRGPHRVAFIRAVSDSAYSMIAISEWLEEKVWDRPGYLEIAGHQDRLCSCFRDPAAPPAHPVPAGRTRFDDIEDDIDDLAGRVDQLKALEEELDRLRTLIDSHFEVCPAAQGAAR